MKLKNLGAVVLTALILMSCGDQMDNPLLSEWNTPFGVPPFDAISLSDYMPAVEQGIAEHQDEIAAIATSAAAPTFDNTILALEESGGLLSRVTNVFYAMNSSNTNDEMQALARDFSPMLSRHDDEILLNSQLFERVSFVYDERASLGLNEEQMTLLEKTYLDYVRNGAALGEAEKDGLKEINEKLSLLTLQFGENVLAETNAFELVIDSEDDLAGLPDGVIAASAEAAIERDHDGKWVFTLHSPSIWPFMQYAENRAAREKIYTAYINRGNHDDEKDNKSIVSQIADLRVERAHLLGYDSHADYVLENNMAKTPAAVYGLLNRIWTPAIERAKEEVAEMQAIIDAEGGSFDLAPWDWWHYSEKVKKAKFDLDEEMLRPYFELEAVKAGAFDVAKKLYGLQFIELPDAPRYHEEVMVYEVREADDSHVGVLFVDYFPRESKGGGAWMSNFREQSVRDGIDVRPVIYNVGNFTKPTADKPSLLSVDEVNTLFHEFGHALHGLLAKGMYERTSGTNVSRDFVELPSQIMENWAMHPEVVRSYAKHHETGEPIPDVLLDKISAAKHFNQGFVTTEYVAASLLDMDWHTRTEASNPNVPEFEKKSLEGIGLIPEIASRYRSTYFAHIFSGGYSSGYYSYIWAEVLDADAFNAFEESGDVFDPATAKAFRTQVLERGSSIDEMELYRRFRGSEPSVEPMLKRRGLLD